MSNKEEYNLQVACVEWLDYQYPNLLRTISPITKLSVIQGVRQKKMGLLAGTPDLMLFEPNDKYKGLFVEFKSKGKIPKVGTKAYNESKQVDFLGRLNNKGYLAVFIDDFDNFTLLIRSYFGQTK